MLIEIIEERKSGKVHAAGNGDGITVCGELVRVVSTTRQDDASTVTCPKCKATLAAKP